MQEANKKEEEVTDQASERVRRRRRKKAAVAEAGRSKSVLPLILWQKLVEAPSRRPAAVFLLSC